MSFGFSIAGVEVHLDSVLPLLLGTLILHLSFAIIVMEPTESGAAPSLSLQDNALCETPDSESMDLPIREELNMDWSIKTLPFTL